MITLTKQSWLLVARVFCIPERFPLSTSPSCAKLVRIKIIGLSGRLLFFERAGESRPKGGVHILLVQ
jgi:hypothetical protein